jgi:hypothetical protein
MRKDEKMKITGRGNKIITRKELFEKKEAFHKQLAKIPFEQKIQILVRLQEIVDNIQRKQRAWKI